MKKFLFFFAAALMSASMFASPASVPTVSDLTGAGYDVTNARVICLYFDEQVCNDIVWAGSYNEWSTTPIDMMPFVPLEGFAGWYVIELWDDSDPCQGKPVQLKNDGSFSWDFQSGDAEAWINMAQPGTKTATIVAGYTGEANCTWPTTGAYIYEVEYFKNHNTPCGAPVEYKYTEYVNWQLKHEGSEWQWTENLVKVGDGVFKLADAYWTGSGFNVGSDANPIKKDWFAPEELVLGEEVLAPVTVDVYLRVIDDETLKIGVGVDPGPKGITVNATVPSGTPACYFYGDMSGNQFAEMTKVDETHYTINFSDATSIGWGYRFVWESGNWSTGNGDPSGDIKVEPIDGVINVEIKAWLNSPGTMCKYTEYVNWQLKHEGSEWQWTENLVKVEDGVFKLADAYWTGSGFNVKSDNNPIKKDWFAPEELVLGEEVLAPVTVDVYLRVIDDETLKIGVGVDPGPDPTSIDPTLLNENANVNKFIHNGQLVIRKDGKKFNVGGVEIR